jgi:hypothetical protein
MEHPLLSYMVTLGNRLKELKQSFAHAPTASQRAHMEEQAELLREALKHYRSGYETELRLRDLLVARESDQK